MKLSKIISKLALCSITAMLFTSCARQISSDVYSSGQVGEVSTTYPGVIRSVRVVTMQNGEQLEDNGLGIVGGGVAGGVVGSAVGRGNLLPTAAGAIAGAVGGAFLEKKLKEQNALEYVVQLDYGGMVTVVQGTDQAFGEGQPVYVLMSPNGRSRIIPQ
jgi:outer membrane lipoprotein SlyB